MAPLIGIVDYGMGNRRSVEKALEHVGARARVSCKPAELQQADGLVLPGVGAFPRAMSNLRELGLEELLHERAAAQTPILGICLGMQLAFERSEELGGAEGLGLLRGEVTPLQTGGLKLPHIGWNQIELAGGSSALLEGLATGEAFYHVHSFAARPADPQDVLALADYGERFATAVAHGSFYGVQFHPEKSSAAGLRLLANFARSCVGAGAPVGG